MESLLQFTLNALMLGSMYSLMAVGFTLFFGVLDVVNFAHSEVFMVGIFSALASISKYYFWKSYYKTIEIFSFNFNSCCYSSWRRSSSLYGNALFSTWN